MELIFLIIVAGLLLFLSLGIIGLLMGKYAFADKPKAKSAISTFSAILLFTGIIFGVVLIHFFMQRFY